MPIRPENYDRYPDDWAIRSVFVRFIRARGKCEFCQAEHLHPHPITGSRVILTTAHLYNKQPEAASLLNLKALCQRCHLNLDKDDHKLARAANARAASPQIDLYDEEAT